MDEKRFVDDNGVIHISDTCSKIIGTASPNKIYTEESPRCEKCFPNSFEKYLLDESDEDKD